VKLKYIPLTAAVTRIAYQKVCKFFVDNDCRFWIQALLLAHHSSSIGYANIDVDVDAFFGGNTVG